MYISTFWIIVSVIWIIYLLWRVYVLKDVLKEFASFHDIGAKNKRSQVRELCGVIMSINREGLSKLSKKEQDRIFGIEARDIYHIFKRNFYGGEDIRGQYFPFDEDINTELSRIFDAAIIPDEDDGVETENIKELSKALKPKLK